LSRNSEPIQLDDIRKKDRRDNAELYLKDNEETRKLSPKQRAFAMSVMENPELPDTAHKKIAGYSENTTITEVKRSIQGKLKHTLEEAGIFESDLGRCLAEGLNANRIRYVKVPIVEDGKVVRYEVKREEEPDFAIRHKYFNSALKLGQYFPAVKVEHSGTQTVEHKVLHILQNVPTHILEQNIKQMESDGVEAEFEEIEEDYDAA